MSGEFVYPYDGSEITLILAYGCEHFTLCPVGSSLNDPRLAFQDAYTEAWVRDLAAAVAFQASVG